jgi:hypothetical protein
MTKVDKPSEAPQTAAARPAGPAPFDGAADDQLPRGLL